MDTLKIVIGHESSVMEHDAVADGFRSAGFEGDITDDYVRKSADNNLPMIIYAVATGVASNLLWDMMKIAFKKLILDKRLKKRKPTIVIKRSGYDAVLHEKGFHIRSVEEVREFNNLEELTAYAKILDGRYPKKDK